MKKISVAVFVIAVFLGAFYFFSKNKDIEKKETITIQEKESSEEVKVHFIKKGNQQKINHKMLVKIQYELYLKDNNRPDLKGKLVEIRKYTGDRKGETWTSGTYLPGIEQALLQMSKESEAWVYIPWMFGFGEKEVGGGLVPAKHDLIAVIKVL